MFFRRLHGNTAAETEAVFLFLIQTVRSVRRKTADVTLVPGGLDVLLISGESLIIDTKLKTDTLFSQDATNTPSSSPTRRIAADQPGQQSIN